MVYPEKMFAIGGVMLGSNLPLCGCCIPVFGIFGLCRRHHHRRELLLRGKNRSWKALNIAGLAAFDLSRAIGLGW